MEKTHKYLRSIIGLHHTDGCGLLLFYADDMKVRGGKWFLFSTPERTEDTVYCGLVNLLPCFPCTYLRGDHDDL